MTADWEARFCVKPREPLNETPNCYHSNERKEHWASALSCCAIYHCAEDDCIQEFLVDSSGWIISHVNSIVTNAFLSLCDNYFIKFTLSSIGATLVKFTVSSVGMWSVLNIRCLTNAGVWKRLISSTHAIILNQTSVAIYMPPRSGIWGIKGSMKGVSVMSPMR